MSAPKDDFKMNWLAFWTVIISLILIGWAFGLIVHPPESEILKCGSRDAVQIVRDSDGTGVIVFCKDYTD